jgi:hypothetical protein
MSWTQITLQDICDALEPKVALDLILAADSLDESELLEHATLEQQELIAQESRRYNSRFTGICSEYELSRYFDQWLADCNFFDVYARDDEPAISEAFCNFVDGLHVNDNLTSTQVSEYCYIGAYS